MTNNNNNQNNHLAEIKREVIQHMLGNNNFTQIGRAISKDRTTIHHPGIKRLEIGYDHGNGLKCN